MPQIGPQSNTFLEISFVESETKIVLSYVVREVVKVITENHARNLWYTGGSDSDRQRKPNWPSIKYFPRNIIRRIGN